MRWLLGLRSAVTAGMNDLDQDGAVAVSWVRVRVRLIDASERPAWDALMRAHHYLGLTALVGRSLRYVAEGDGQWLALLGWASAALKCAPRDAWIGWAKALQWQRIGLIANNARFLTLPGVQVRNLASQVLGANLRRLSSDWQAVHGHGLMLAETFIDPARFAGTRYRAANWIALGPRAVLPSPTTPMSSTARPSGSGCIPCIKRPGSSSHQ